MTIPSPNLDDRDFEALMARAREVVLASQSSWNDFSPGDPGIVLLEAFAYLTDILIYRLNRVPEKAHREFLRLLDTSLGPPSAATAELLFAVDDIEGSVTIEAGTAVEASDDASDVPIVFLTDSEVTLSKRQREARVMARHCRQVWAELIGVSSGEPGQRFTLADAPVVLPTGDERDLLIAVETDAARLSDRAQGIDVEGRSFEVWPVVETFATTDPDQRAVMIDRQAGTVTFGPAVRGPVEGGGVGPEAVPLAAVPPEGAQIRAWYRCGGGSAGNVAPATITSIVGGTTAPVTVVNPARAVGGRDSETVEQAIDRASNLFHEPRRAVTADDFEALAGGHGAVGRALAITAGEQWAHASPGTVNLHLVSTDGATTEDSETAPTAILDEVQGLVEQRQPLGIATNVQWARFKRVSISLTVVVSAGEDPESVQRRVIDRIAATIDPLPSATGSGWPFGQALRASNIYDAALREPGVRYAESVRIDVDEAPESDVRVVAADFHQPSTWYATSGNVLFRSEDDGDGWEAIWRVAGGEVNHVLPAERRPGRVAVVASVTGEGRTTSLLYLSDDCGSTFSPDPAVAFSWTDGELPQRINDVCWLPAGHNDDLLLATDRGLYRFRQSERTPVPLEGAPTDNGYWAVATAVHSATEVTIFAAQKENAGIVVGSAGSYTDGGLAEIDIRRLVVEQRGTRQFVWAPISVEGMDTGSGCLRAELLAQGNYDLRWAPLATGWNGGSCRDVAIVEGGILAASEFGGVLRRDDGESGTPWEPPNVNCGLPLQDDRRFNRIWSVAGRGSWVMAATDEGVFVTADGESFESAASQSSTEIVTIPKSWLFRNGEHEVTVRSENR